MTFTIIFIGLIAHLRYTPLNEPTRNVAVLVTAQNHVAELIVPPGAEIPTSRAHFTGTVDALGNTHYDISNHVLTFVGLPTGRVVRTSRFSSDVPKLADISKTTDLEPTYVAPEKVGGFVNTFIDLPSGTLDITAYYSQGGVHSVIKQRTCVPCATQFTAAVSGDSVEVVSDAGQHLLLNPDAVITVQNLKTGGNDPDYAKFATLMKNGTDAGTWSVCSVACPCTKGAAKCPPISGPNLECSNSTFP